MEVGSSRRRLLAAIGASSTALAGCTDFISDDGENGDDENGNGNGDGNGDGDGNGGNGEDELAWPALERGDLVSDFEDLDQWLTHFGSLSATDDAVNGSQAALLEREADSDPNYVAVGMNFAADPLDLEEESLSLAVKPESVDRIQVEIQAPTGSANLETVRQVPDDLNDWFRLDCGYEGKPGDDEPDLSNVQQVNIFAIAPDGEPARMAVDDLRTTEIADNGKAMLLFYAGRQSHYDIGADLMEEYGWQGAIPMSENEIGVDGRMSLTELQELRDDGWDVMSRPQTHGTPLPEQDRDHQEHLIETSKQSLESAGFEDGARHFYAPDHMMDGDTYELVREHHETAFVEGSCPTTFPPTENHVIPHTYGPAIHSGVRRHINLAMQYPQLTVFRIPRIVEDPDEDDAGVMSVDDFEHLLDHIDSQGLDVITPSEMVDEY